MDDLISRRQAINELVNKGQLSTRYKLGEFWELNGQEIRETLNAVPSAQPEPSISLSWIKEHIEWLKSLDNEFANLAATHISVMVKKWRSEQDE